MPDDKRRMRKLRGQKRPHVTRPNTNRRTCRMSPNNNDIADLLGPKQNKVTESIVWKIFATKEGVHFPKKLVMESWLNISILEDKYIFEPLSLDESQELLTMAITTFNLKMRRERLRSYPK